MGLIGVFSGLLFVPLNALLQWRAPDDRRGAVIALANVLVYRRHARRLGRWRWCWPRRGVSARGTFLGASIVLAGGFALGALAGPRRLPPVPPDPAGGHALSRPGARPRERARSEGGALLTPNHVSFADGLFLIASIDRPVRFVVYADYFRPPAPGPVPPVDAGDPDLRRAAGPKMILQAFREAGQALDDGELVCIFPEGQITRTGMLQPFQRGLQRIVKGRTTPIIPVHLDRATASIFSPMQHAAAPRADPVAGDRLVRRPRCPPTRPLHEIRQAIHDLDQEAWAHRKADRRPLHHEFIRQARRHPVPAGLRRRVSARASRASGRSPARSPWPARCGRAGRASRTSASCCRPSVAAALVNLAASLVGRAVGQPQLHRRPGRRWSRRRSRPGSGPSSPAGPSSRRPSSSCPRASSRSGSRTSRDAIAPRRPAAGPARSPGSRRSALLERLAGADAAARRSTTPATIIFSSGSTGEPEGGGPLALQHRLQRRGDRPGLPRPADRPAARHPAALPLVRLHVALARRRTAGWGWSATPTRSTPRRSARWSSATAATILLATPTFLQLYLRRCAPAQFGSLRLVIAGAEKLPEALAAGVRGPLRHPPAGGLRHDRVLAGRRRQHARLPGARVLPARLAARVTSASRCRASRSGSSTPRPASRSAADTPGMVLVKGPNVMRGYLGRDDLTAAALRDGWYVTGDIGLVDEDGFLKITGRLSRFSKIGGEMVPHGRVEEALHQAIGADEPGLRRDGRRRRAARASSSPSCTPLDDDRVDEALEKLCGRRPAQPVHPPPRPLRQGRCPPDPGHRQARPPRLQADRRRGPSAPPARPATCPRRPIGRPTS